MQYIYIYVVIRMNIEKKIPSVFQYGYISSFWIVVSI